MRLRSLSVPVLSCLISLATAAPLTAQQKRPITEKDLFDFHWIGDVQLSPDGRRVVFVQTTVSPAHDGYETGLYLLDLTAAAEPVRLTAGTHDGSPRWSPDGRQIAFTRAAERDGKPSPSQVYVMAAEPKASPVRLTICRRVRPHRAGRQMVPRWWSRR